MTLEEKMRKFWDFLNEVEAEVANSIHFNVICFKKAQELDLESYSMNSLISAWACTLDPTFPERLLKFHKVI